MGEKMAGLEQRVQVLLESLRVGLVVYNEAQLFRLMKALS